MNEEHKRAVRLLMAAMLGGAALLGACKREAAKVPTAIRRPRMAGPTGAEIANEKLEVLRQDLEPIPDMGQGIVEKTPDGEIWTKFSNGLMIHDLLRADGLSPKLGQTVRIAYKGTFPSPDPATAKVFDKKGANDPLIFQLGSKSLIRGFSLGIATMKEGGKRRIYVPADLAYGSAGRPQGNIPPNQPLIFEVELLGVSGDALDIGALVPKAEPLGPPAPATASGPATKP